MRQNISFYVCGYAQRVEKLPNKTSCTWIYAIFHLQTVNEWNSGISFQILNTIGKLRKKIYFVYLLIIASCNGLLLKQKYSALHFPYCVKLQFFTIIQVGVSFKCQLINIDTINPWNSEVNEMVFSNELTCFVNSTIFSHMS